MPEPVFRSLRDFIERLRRDGDLAVVDAPVEARLEAAEIHRRVSAAGGPALLFTNVAGSDFPLATNLFGPYLLTELLLPKLEASPDARVVSVASGGMYTQKLDVKELLAGGPDPFDGVVQYARTKRALVVLNELWAERPVPCMRIGGAQHEQQVTDAHD